jgi:hypothetical protein
VLLPCQAPFFWLDERSVVFYDLYNNIPFFGGVMANIWNFENELHDFSFYEGNLDRLARNLLSLSLSLSL